MLTNRLVRAYALYTIGFAAFVLLLWRIERATGPGVWIGYVCSRASSACRAR